MGTDVRTVRCAEMGTTTRSGGGARAPSASTAPYAAAQATPPAPPLALPSPPARGSREGARGQSLAPGGGGGVPFQGRRAPKSRRDSAKHVAKAPQVPPELLKRTWDYVARMDKDGVTDALCASALSLIYDEGRVYVISNAAGEHLRASSFAPRDVTWPACLLVGPLVHGVLVG